MSGKIQTEEGVEPHLFSFRVVYFRICGIHFTSINVCLLIIRYLEFRDYFVENDATFDEAKRKRTTMNKIFGQIKLKIWKLVPREIPKSRDLAALIFLKRSLSNFGQMFQPDSRTSTRFIDTRNSVACVVVDRRGQRYTDPSLRRTATDL